MPQTLGLGILTSLLMHEVVVYNMSMSANDANLSMAAGCEEKENTLQED